MRVTIFFTLQNLQNTENAPLILAPILHLNIKTVQENNMFAKKVTFLAILSLFIQSSLWAESLYSLSQAEDNISSNTNASIDNDSDEEFFVDDMGRMISKTDHFLQLQCDAHYRRVKSAYLTQLKAIKKQKKEAGISTFVGLIAAVGGFYLANQGYQNRDPLSYGLGSMIGSMGTMTTILSGAQYLQYDRQGKLLKPTAPSACRAKGYWDDENIDEEMGGNVICMEVTDSYSNNGQYYSFERFDCGDSIVKEVDDYDMIFNSSIDCVNCN